MPKRRRLPYILIGILLGSATLALFSKVAGMFDGGSMPELSDEARVVVREELRFVEGEREKELGLDLSMAREANAEHLEEIRRLTRVTHQLHGKLRTRPVETVRVDSIPPDHISKDESLRSNLTACLERLKQCSEDTGTPCLVTDFRVSPECKVEIAEIEGKKMGRLFQKWTALYKLNGQEYAAAIDWEAADEVEFSFADPDPGPRFSKVIGGGIIGSTVGSGPKLNFGFQGRKWTFLIGGGVLLDVTTDPKEIYDGEFISSETTEWFADLNVVRQF